MHVVAIDIGYGNVKLAAGAPGAEPRLTQWIACALPVADAGEDVFGTARPADVTIDGASWYVGIDPKSVIFAPDTLNSDYVGSQPWRAHLVYGLRKATDDKGPRRRIDRLVLGLPVDEWQSIATRNRTAEAARGGAAEAGVDVGEIKVMAQPMGAFIYANLLNDGALVPRVALVIDAGFNTLDWSLFVEGKLQAVGSGTTRNGGVTDICHLVQRALHDREGIEVGEAQVRSALTNGGILYAAQDHTRADLIDEIAGTVARGTLAEVTHSVRPALRSLTAKQVHYIVLTGGGASYYRAAAGKAFKGARLVSLDRAVTANAHGMWFFRAHRD